MKDYFKKKQTNFNDKGIWDDILQNRFSFFKRITATQLFPNFIIYKRDLVLALSTLDYGTAFDTNASLASHFKLFFSKINVDIVELSII